MKNELSKKDYDILKESLSNIIILIIYIIIIVNRPTLKEYSPDLVDFLLNTLPNFLAGFVGTVAFYKYLKRYREGLLFSILISGIWLTIEEYYPIFSHNLYFDYWDIVMSWIGCIISAFLIKKKKFKII